MYTTFLPRNTISYTIKGQSITDSLCSVIGGPETATERQYSPYSSCFFRLASFVCSMSSLTNLFQENPHYLSNIPSKDTSEQMLP